MALDKVLKIYDEQGNPVDYDILAKDVKFQPDGKDLPTKLAEMEQEIEDAAGGGYAPPAGGIPKSDLASGVQSSLDKADTALQQSDKTELQNEINNKVDAVNGKGLSTNDYTNEDKAAVATIANKANSADVYTKSQTYDKSEVDAKVADAGKVKSVTINGTKKTPNETTGDVDLGTIVGQQGPKGDKGDTLLVDGEFNPITDIVNDTTTGGANKAWSAEMGKQLAEEVDNIPIIAISVVGNEIVINTNAALAPTVIIGALNKSALSCRAGNTDAATFNISGRRLTGNIGISLSDNTHFSVSPSSLSPSGGVVETTQIAITYTPGAGATAGTSHSCIVTITSGGVTYGTLELTGTVAAAPSITLAPATQTISTESGQSAICTINVKGNALDGDITLAISGSGFSLSTNTVTKAEAESAGGKDITVTFDGSAAGNATITASSSGAIDATASVSGSVIQRLNEGDTILDNTHGLTYTVLADTTKVSVKATSASLSGDIVIPSSVEDSGVNYEVASIPTQGFQGAQITSIVLPDTLKDIGRNAFYGCSSLTSINLGNGLESISGNTPFFNTRIESIVFPDSFKTVANSTLQGMSLLTSVQLGKTTAFSPTDIKLIFSSAGSSTDDAVQNSIVTVICYAVTPPTLIFRPKGISGTTLKVPSGSVGAYKAATYWKEFGAITSID